jgi:hypothetical protein
LGIIGAHFEFPYVAYLLGSARRIIGMNVRVSEHELGFRSDPIKSLPDQSLSTDALLQQAARVLAWLAALILLLILAGAVYQAIAGMLFLILAVAGEVAGSSASDARRGAKPSGPA